MDKHPHLLVFISSHGFGHIAQTAPVLNALRKLIPGLALTIRSTAPLGQLRSRIHGEFEYLPLAGDIGMLMSSALDVRAAESAAAYRELHGAWEARVASEATLLRDIAPDFVLSNIGYLPLAGAQRAGIPCAAMCSLNWADIHSHYCQDPAITAQIHRAYAGAQAFLRLTPGMAMVDLPNRILIDAVAEVGRNRREEINHRLGLGYEDKLVLVSLGGISGRLPIETWPRQPGVRWLVQTDWRAEHPNAVALESLQMEFSDLLASSDALVCKPGYGSFVEAACSGVPALFASRADWPESSALTDWLKENGLCREVSRQALEGGDFATELQAMWDATRPEPVHPSGIAQAADWLAARLLPR
ncbi:MAG TPA: hypothetical protein PKW44_06675 [Methylophilaceae bacterium]|nr:hypothetical protein [Methylophilaceae bacterium]HQR60636.1 hypothetical protein [Methylophilaceae bacterium]